MKDVLRGVAVAVLLLSAAPLLAQMRGGQRFGAPPAFLDQLYVPELIMRYQEEIGLTAEQREAITQAMGDTQKKLVELQWQSEAASKKLTDILSDTNVDEAAALAQAEQVMNLEVQMKKTHLGLLIRIKKVLTPAQQTKLRELRAKEPARPGPPFHH